MLFRSGAAATSSPPPSLQSFRPDFSDVGSALASMAQARAAMLNAEQNAGPTGQNVYQWKHSNNRIHQYRYYDNQ